jgi:hypothetical protein
MTFLKSLAIPTFVVLLAVLAPFFFPWPIAFALGIFSAFFVPPASIINGGLIDMLYFSAQHGLHIFPYFTILGVIVAIIGVFVQQFLKTRIMS